MIKRNLATRDSEGARRVAGPDKRFGKKEKRRDEQGSWVTGRTRYRNRCSKRRWRSLRFRERAVAKIQVNNDDVIRGLVRGEVATDKNRIPDVRLLV
jgi:hypothetical protein